MKAGVQLSFSFFISLGPNMMMPALSRCVFPDQLDLSGNTLSDITQRYISMVTLKPAKLTMKASVIYSVAPVVR